MFYQCVKAGNGVSEVLQLQFWVRNLMLSKTTHLKTQNSNNSFISAKGFSIVFRLQERLKQTGQKLIISNKDLCRDTPLLKKDQVFVPVSTCPTRQMKTQTTISHMICLTHRSYRKGHQAIGQKPNSRVCKGSHSDVLL